MAVRPGSRFGAYEILDAIGAGGMGEVYRAHDSGLRRDVAVKVLPGALAKDADRLARFEREAHVLASLNHTNIAAIYGLERLDDTPLLIMELVPGRTLADLIRERAVAPDDALLFAAQIAAALEAAHAKGIVHRDLKPANVIVTPEGKVKVLDFGLAKALQDPNTSGPQDLTNAPTIPAPMMTAAGIILGTASYMSPEQARGKALDTRTDLWSFGCVLFEMLTSRPAFTGDTLTDILAAVLNNEPDWAAIPAETPSGIRGLLRRCLQRDPGRRVQHAGDARIEIEDAMERPIAAPQESRSPSSRVRLAAPWAVAAVLAIALGATQLGPARQTQPEAAVTRLELNMPAGVEAGVAATPNMSVSADGTRLAFIGGTGGLRRLYVRRFDESSATAIRGTETVTVCVFSPDGSAVAFITADNILKKVSLADGLVTTIVTDADYTGGGAAWGTDGSIIFIRAGSLWQVPSTGGTPQQLTTLELDNNEYLHLWPTVVAGGDAILFASVSGERDRVSSKIEALSLATRRRHVVVDDGSNPIYTTSGHLVFFRNETLLAAPFDATRLELTGPEVAVLDDVSVDQFGNPMLTVSTTGMLVFADSRNATKQLVWVSREGVEQPITDTSRPYGNPRLSPDGGRIVVEVAGGDLWIQDLARATFTRLTSGATTGDTFSTWTPDGRRVVFRTLTGLYQIDADGGGGLEAIPNTSVADVPTAVSRDGKTLALIRQSAELSGGVLALSLESGETRVVVQTRAYDGGGQFSPDDRWLAYVSNESGQFETYVRPYPGPERTIQVSTAGGTHPKWSRDGRELFYRNGNKMMAVDVSTTPDLALVSAPCAFRAPLRLWQRADDSELRREPGRAAVPDGQG